MKQELRPYIFYFLGFFYYKNKDFFKAKDVLKRCIGLKPDLKVKKSALDLLSHIWKHKIKPPWWRWWISAPVFSSLKRMVFILMILSVFGLLSLHPFISELSSGIYSQISWPLYALLVLFFIFILLSPSIMRPETRELEFNLQTPPAFRPVFSTIRVKQKMLGIKDQHFQPGDFN